MNHATQVSLMRRIFGFLDADTTELAPHVLVNRVATYTDALQLERERRVFFTQESMLTGEPLFVGLRDDVPESGSRLVFDAAGPPILVSRREDGSLHGLLLICRHRGARLPVGRAAHGRMVCPYHGWTYDGDGRLVAQPCADGFSEVAPDSLPLVRVPVTEAHGMIFARTAPGILDVNRHLGGSGAELAALGLENYRRFARREVACRMNWKLVVDTFLEAYHVPTLHKRTLGARIFGAPAAWDSFGRCGRMVAVRRSITRARALPESKWNLLDHSVVLYLLFPNTILIHQLDHVEVVQVFPGAEGVGSACVVFSLYTPSKATTAKARKHFQANFDLLLHVTTNEDFRLCEQIQRDFESGALDTVVYGRNEPGLVHYHSAINAALGIEAGRRVQAVSSRSGA